MPSELRVDKVSSTTSPYDPVFSTTGGALSHRNIIINGAMQVAQRGTSFTGVGNGDNDYYLDRFEFIESGSPNGEFTITQSTDAPNGFGNSMKLDCTTAESDLAAGERIRLRQRIEGQNLQVLKKGTSDAEKVTLSFYVKSNLTGTAIVSLYDNDNSRHIAKSYTIDSVNTWERKIITFEGDTTGTLDNDNEVSIEVRFHLQAGSEFTSGTLATSWASFTSANSAVGQTINIASSTDNEFFITGIQLELGSVATPFEHRSYGDDLQSCLRYYEFICGGIGMAHSTSTTTASYCHSYSVHKRTGATAYLKGSLYVNDGSAQVTVQSISNQYHSQTTGIFLNISTNTINNNEPILVYSTSSSAGLEFDAEL